jgi:acyl-coenzyme A synthetase/AMP-(fatty) acid ligase
VKVGGHRVSAREIEETIEGCSVGLRAAVVGAPHDVLGEALVAFVAPSFESDTRQVLDLCRGRLAAARMPEVIVHLSELPQGANGKILKAELQSLAEMVLRSSTDGVDPRITRVERLRSGGLPRREERIR